MSSDADRSAPRTFTDEEVRAIFAAATDREAEADRAGATAPSAPDLEELKRIGAEAGIAPEHVEAAARSVIRRPPGELPVPATEVGVSTARRWLSGPVDDATWERIVVTLRDEFGGPGSTSRFGEVLEWVGPEEKHVQARLEPHGQGMEISLSLGDSEDWRAMRGLGLALSLVGLLLGLLIVLGSFPAETVLLPVVFAALGAVTYGGAWALLPLIERRNERRLAAVLDRLELLAG